MLAPQIQIAPLVFTLLIVWRLTVRFRRNVGRQTFRRNRLIRTICIYSLLTVLLAVGAFLAGESPVVLIAGLLGGLVLGAALGFYGLQLTQFEATPQGLFYTPNPYMGIGVSMLFVARLAYRVMVLSATATRANAPQAFRSPLTLCLFGLLAGYYITYYVGVMMRSNESSRPAP